MQWPEIIDLVTPYIRWRTSKLQSVKSYELLSNLLGFWQNCI